jgi:hypothetical protein
MVASTKISDENLFDLNIENIDPEKTPIAEEDREVSRPQALNGGLAEFEKEPSTSQVTITSNKILNYLDELGLKLENSDHVKWKTDATAHPRNWSASRKFFNLAPVLLLDLFTLVFLLLA